MQNLIDQNTITHVLVVLSEYLTLVNNISFDTSEWLWTLSRKLSLTCRTFNIKYGTGLEIDSDQKYIIFTILPIELGIGICHFSRICGLKGRLSFCDYVCNTPGFGELGFRIGNATIDCYVGASTMCFSFISNKRFIQMGPFASDSHEGYVTTYRSSYLVVPRGGMQPMNYKLVGDELMTYCGSIMHTELVSVHNTVTQCNSSYGVYSWPFCTIDIRHCFTERSPMLAVGLKLASFCELGLFATMYAISFAAVYSNPEYQGTELTVMCDYNDMDVQPILCLRLPKCLPLVDHALRNRQVKCDVEVFYIRLACCTTEKDVHRLLEEVRDMINETAKCDFRRTAFVHTTEGAIPLDFMHEEYYGMEDNISSSGDEPVEWHGPEINDERADEDPWWEEPDEREFDRGYREYLDYLENECEK